MRLLTMLVGTAGLSVALTLAAVPALAGEPTSQAMRVGVRHNMEATLYTPDGPGPYPTVLLMHTSAGLTETDKGWCLKLAREGFICIVPAFLLAHGNLKGQLRSLSFTTAAQEIYDQFRRDHRRTQSPAQGPAGRGQRRISFSNGGYFALWLAATRQVKAGVSYYGALQGAGTDPQLTRFAKTFNAESSPVLELAGQNDTTIGMKVVNHLEKILKTSGAPYEVKIYPDARARFRSPHQHAPRQPGRRRRRLAAHAGLLPAVPAVVFDGSSSLQWTHSLPNREPLALSSTDEVGAVRNLKVSKALGVTKAVRIRLVICDTRRLRKLAKPGAIIVSHLIPFQSMCLVM